MSQSEKLDIATLWLELSGPATDYASSVLPGATAGPSALLPNINPKSAARILEEIYITIWSRDSFIQHFEKNQKLRLKVVAKKNASIKLLNQCHNGELLLHLNNSITAVSKIWEIKCGAVNGVSVTNMETNSVSTQKYDEMMTQSQFNIMKLVKQNADRIRHPWDRASFSLGNTPVLDETKIRPLFGPAAIKAQNTDLLDETQPKQILESQPQHEEDKKETTETQRETSQQETGTFHWGPSEQTNIYTGTVNQFKTSVNQEPVVDIEALGQELSQQLWSQAKARSSYLECPVENERTYKMAQLEIAENASMQTNGYEYETSIQHREQLLQRFSECAGNISINEIFIKSKAHAGSQKANHNQNVAFPYGVTMGTSQPPNPNIVGVIGQAGIGKTTFTKMLIQQVLSQQILKSVSYLFYIFVREIDFKRDCNVLQFLVRSALPEWKFTEERDHALIEQINTDANVLVVIDGFDEAVRTTSRCEKISLYEQTSPELILLNLMSGDILPSAKKVITSRPAEMFGLHSTARPAFLLKILGLSKESQDILGQQICGDSYEDLKIKLYKNPDLSLYWYVPIYCIMALSYFANTEGKISESFTFTSLLTMTFIDYVTTDHMRGKEAELEKLTNLAWIGILGKKCIFSISSLKKVGLDYSSVQAFLQMALSKGLRVNMSILQGDQLIFFSHLVWQEYFASIYYCLIMPIDQFNQHLKSNMIVNSGVVLKFVFGLLNHDIYSQLQSVFSVSSELLMAKKKLLYSLMKDLGSKTNNSLKDLLEYSCLLWEAQDESMLQAYITGINPAYVSTPITLEGSLLPSDIASLCYLLRGFQNQNTSVRGIHIASGPQNRCTFIGDAFTRLALEIGSGLKLEELKLSGFRFGDEGAKAVSTCVATVKQLHINKCNITQKGLPEIRDRLLQLNDPMTELNLGQNKLTDFGAELLAPCIPYIQELHLDNCDITEVSVQTIAQNVVLLNGSIELLNLSGNKVGNKGAAALAKGLHKIKQLILFLCHITEEGSTVLATKAKNLPSQMDLLDLSENKIGDEAVEAFSHCKEKIGTLKLVFCSMNASQKELLKDINVEY